jgi:hypothetical protein
MKRGKGMGDLGPAPNPATLNPVVDQRAFSLNPYPWATNTTVYQKQYMPINPQVPYSATNEPDFLIPATTQNGSMISLYDSIIEMEYSIDAPQQPSNYNVATNPNIGSIIHPYFGGLLRWQDVKFRANGVNIDDAVTGYYPFSSFHKVCLLYPYRPLEAKNFRRGPMINNAGATVTGTSLAPDAMQEMNAIAYTVNGPYAPINLTATPAVAGVGYVLEHTYHAPVDYADMQIASPPGCTFSALSYNADNIYSGAYTAPMTDGFSLGLIYSILCLNNCSYSTVVPGTGTPVVGTGVIRDKLFHPMWMQRNYLPSDILYELQLTKCNQSATTNNSGNGFNGDLAFAFFKPYDLRTGTPQAMTTRQMSITKITLQLCRITLTNAGVQARDILLYSPAYNGMYTYPLLRAETLRFPWPTGTSSQTIIAGTGRKPQALVLHWVSNNACNYNGFSGAFNPMAIGAPYNLLWQPGATISTTGSVGPANTPDNDAQGAWLSPQRIQITFGSDRYPDPWQIWRNANPSNATQPGYNGLRNGSSLRDYEMYKSLCRPLQSGDELTTMQPFLSYDAYTSGQFGIFFINLTKAQEGFFGEKEVDPGIGPLQVEINLNNPAPNNSQLLITRLFNDSVMIGNGRVQRSW